MQVFDWFLKFSPLVLSVVSAIIAILSFKKSSAKAAYIDQDSNYANLLKMAFEHNPEFRDVKYINQKFKEGDRAFLNKYNIYANLIWNCLETFYDLSTSSSFFKHKKAVDETWLPVILEENKIHYTWFKQNQRLFKEEFRRYINKINDVKIRQGTVADLPEIYAMLKTLFPPNELKAESVIRELMTKKSYVLFIAENPLVSGGDKTIGCALLYNMPAHKTAWLDYFAVNPTYQDGGYGTLLFNNIASTLNGGVGSMFMELEIPKSNDPKSQENRRIRFYERQGVKLLDIKYKLPIGAGVPMYLAYKAGNASTFLSDELLGAVIGEMFETVHSAEPNMQKIRDEILAGLKDIYL
jgi:ribosomal protein S18 acetylase RimI-like enzyme